MGDWNLTIQGTGPHHNQPGNDDTDVDKIAPEFVDRLKAAGHTIRSASLTYGGAEEVEPTGE